MCVLAAACLGFGGCPRAWKAGHALLLAQGFRVLVACKELTGCVRRVQAADDAANGLGSTLLSEIPVGASLTSAALFIDETSSQVRMHGVFTVARPSFRDGAFQWGIGPTCGCKCGTGKSFY